MTGGARPNPVPPSSKARLNSAVTLFESFTGHDPEYIDTVQYPRYDTLLKIGELDGVLYTTVRDGKTESYIHRFKKKSRPQLASSFDGLQLYVLGGGYTFTDRGIVDR